MTTTRRAFTALVLLTATLPALGQDWPQWRGPQRDGVARGVRPPAQWPDKLRELYRVELGEGHASPVIIAGRLYTFFRAGDREVVRCLDADAGKEVWSFDYAAPYKVDPAAAQHGPGPKVTPTVADGRVYTQGMSSQLYCLDATSGKVLWHRDLAKEYKTDGPQYGTSASLLVDGDLVIALTGGRKEGAVVAFDKSTGQERWKTPTDGPAYAAPMAFALAGTRQLLTFTRGSFIGLSPQDGRILWQIPYTTNYEQNILTPVVWNDLVIISGFARPTLALRVSRAGEQFKAEEVWKNNDLRMYLSSPVIVGDHLYGHNFSRAGGPIVCIDLKSGKTVWSKGRMGDYVSLVVLGDRLLCLDETAELTVLEATPKEYKELAKYKVSDSPTWAHLAVTPGRLYVKDKTRLICFELPK